MSSASADPAPTHAGGLGAAALPWLLSSTLHMLAILLLALSWQWATDNAPPAAGITLDASFLSASGHEDVAPTIQLDTPPADGYFDDQEPVLYADEREQSPTGGSSLKSLLAEEPAVDLAGVLPSTTAELGIGGEHAGIASATSLANEPPPPNRMRGGQARTGVFGLVGEGYKFVYVFDRSGSMDGHGGAPLVAAKRELINSLKDLGTTHQFQIIFYNEKSRIFNPAGRDGRLVFGNDQNKNLARRFVGSITASGATRHMEALEMALRMGPDVIFFLTDADEPQMTPQELAHIAQMNRGTAINTIEFGTDGHPEPDNFIARLARQNGGQHVYIDVSRLGRDRP